MANQISISNVINISVASVGQGLGAYNTSNTAIFTQEVYGMGFGSLGYKIYKDPSAVATDFGSASDTYKMALGIFSQQPNILANNGYLVVIPFVPNTQTITPSGIPASGAVVFEYDGDATASIAWDDTASEIQTKIRAIAGLESVTVTGTLATEVTIVGNGVYGPMELFTFSSNTLETSAPAAITLTAENTVEGETYAEAITRTNSVVQYFALMPTLILDETDTLAAAAVIQTLNKVGLFVYNDADEVAPDTGIIDLLTTAGYTQSRGLLYTDDDVTEALLFMARYAGRGFSTIFSGSNTTQNMHLKTLIGQLPDPNMDESLLQLCQDAGADVYVSIQGVPKVFSSGANKFFDQVYNLRWYVGALQVALFNVLAQNATKIPQTQNGIDALVGAATRVSDQAVSNQYLNPGEWTDPVTFGVQEDLYRNIREIGYYIYTAPLATQLPADRVARIAPLMQIAIKEAGAINKGNVVIFVNP